MSVLDVLVVGLLVPWLYLVAHVPQRFAHIGGRAVSLSNFLG